MKKQKQWIFNDEIIGIVSTRNAVLDEGNSIFQYNLNHIILDFYVKITMGA